MTATTSTPETKKTPKPVVRDKDFARRLEMACEGSPNCPTDEYRGKQKWVRDQLLAKHGIKASAEAVSRWFQGVMRPRPSTIAALAQILEVDEVWLNLGLKPDLTKAEKKVRDAQVAGMVNVVAGIIQMGGGTIAFPEGNEDIDITAIVKGKVHNVSVKLARAMGDNVFKFVVPRDASNLTVIGLIDDGGFSFTMLRFTTELIETHGRRHSDLFEIEVKKSGRHFVIGDDVVPQIKAIENLDGSSR